MKLSSQTVSRLYSCRCLSVTVGGATWHGTHGTTATGIEHRRRWRATHIACGTSRETAEFMHMCGCGMCDSRVSEQLLCVRRLVGSAVAGMQLQVHRARMAHGSCGTTHPHVDHTRATRSTPLVSPDHTSRCHAAAVTQSSHVHVEKWKLYGAFRSAAIHEAWACAHVRDVDSVPRSPPAPPCI